MYLCRAMYYGMVCCTHFCRYIYISCKKKESAIANMQTCMYIWNVRERNHQPKNLGESNVIGIVNFTISRETIDILALLHNKS